MMAQVFYCQTVTTQGLDDLRNRSLALCLGIYFGLGKEGTGLPQQVLEPAVGQGFLPDGR